MKAEVSMGRQANKMEILGKGYLQSINSMGIRFD